MHEFQIKHNDYLNQDIRAFYHAPYKGYKQPENPDYLNTLKNTYDSHPELKLNYAVKELKFVLFEDLPQVLERMQLDLLTVCVVPRSKRESTYSQSQLLFQSTVQGVVKEIDGFDDGTDYIVRHTNTKTTHFRTPPPNYNNDGKEPYPGITADTCNISNDVRGRDILLVDDIYTLTVNIDEDAIQSLLDNGAKSVIFYAVGKTDKRY